MTIEPNVATPSRRAKPRISIEAWAAVFALLASVSMLLVPSALRAAPLSAHEISDVAGISHEVAGRGWQGGFGGGYRPGGYGGGYRPGGGGPNWLKIIPQIEKLSKGCSRAARRAGWCGGGRPGGRPGGSSPPPKRDRITCINGSRAGKGCICRAGLRVTALGNGRFKCIPVAGSCPPGKVRAGRRCIDIVRPDPPRPGCIGGRSVGGACICPAGTRPTRLSRWRTRCVASPCPSGSKRAGRHCIAIETAPPSVPPPPFRCPTGKASADGRCPSSDCPSGWSRMAGRCQRIVDTSCPAGSVRKGAICAAITLPPPRPPPVAAVPPPVRTPGQAATAAADSDFVPDEVLIEITDATPKPIVDRLIATYALQLLSERRLTYLDVGLYRLRIPRSETVPSVVAALSREAGVAAAQPNYIYRLNAGSVATAPVKLPQYAVDLIKARQAHGVSRGQNVLVAVIDTGIDRGHPEIGDAVTKSFDAFTADSGQASPASNAKVATATGAAIAGATGDGSTGPFADAHGTGIAGIIAASGQLQGVAPDARILAVRAFEGTSSATEPRVSAGGARSGRGGNVGARGTGTTERVAAGLDWALENGARVVNMSFEGSRDDLVTRLIDKGDGDGVVFVAAAGNGGPKARPAFPAALPAVIAVTAIDDRQAIYAHANAGAYIDLAAPGVNVLVPAPDNAYDMASGTSFAAAHVSGIAALVLSRSPRIGRAGLRDQLRSTAVDLGKPGSDETFGAGAVDAMKALDDQTAQAAAPSRR